MEPVELGIITGVCLGFFPVDVTKFPDKKHVREEMAYVVLQFPKECHGGRSLRQAWQSGSPYKGSKGVEKQEVGPSYKTSNPARLPSRKCHLLKLQ